MEHLIYFKALSDETRLRLMNILLHHELKVGELVSIMEMGQSRISRHLKILSDAGLVKSLKTGVWGLYFVADDGPAKRFMDAIGYLFESAPVFKSDLERAATVIEERRSSTLAFFNDVAATWSLLKREIIGGFDLNRAIFKNAGTYAVGVDLGCGTGDLLPTLKRHAAKVIGVDSSPRMLEEARKRFPKGENIEIRLGEIEHLPLRDAEADFAVISLVLQYMSRPEDAFPEVGRVLRPGGRFVIADFETHQDRTLRDKYGARRLGFDRREIDRWLIQNGFITDRIESYKLDKGLILNIFNSTKAPPQS